MVSFYNDQNVIYIQRTITDGNAFFVSLQLSPDQQDPKDILFAFPDPSSPGPLPLVFPCIFTDTQKVWQPLRKCRIRVTRGDAQKVQPSS